MQCDRNEAPGNNIQKLLDATLLIAIATGSLYFLNVVYLTFYYFVFGLDVSLFTMPLPDTLIACPAITLVAFIFLIIGLSDTEKKHRLFKPLHWDHTSLQSSLKFIFTVSYWLMVLSIVFGLACGMYAYSDKVKNKALFVLNGKSISDYSLLTKSNGYYYFFRRYQDGKTAPTVRIISTDLVKDLTIRPVEEVPSKP